MTYNEAYDKIIQAYFRDEIKPYKANFCFCGTLCDNSYNWHGQTHPVKSKSYHFDYNGYSGAEFVEMESALLGCLSGKPQCDKPNWENALFLGMTAALEVLKQIHRERGEDVDSLPALKKRKLQPTL